MNYLDVCERRSFHEGITDALGDILVWNDPCPPGFCYPDAQIKTINTQDLAAINGPFSMPLSCPARSLSTVERNGPV